MLGFYLPLLIFFLRKVFICGGSNAIALLFNLV
jgi:hypothetical protein